MELDFYYHGRLVVTSEVVNFCHASPLDDVLKLNDQ